MRIPEHLIHLLRNLYADFFSLYTEKSVCQGATVKTVHGRSDWFQIEKGVHQGCILSPCLFNFYAEYIMQDASLMKHKLESRLLREISITKDMQMSPPLWQESE